MAGNKSQFLDQTVQNIFGTNDRYIQSAGKNISGKKALKAHKHELELALTVLLVELASSDQSFDMPEYNAIANGLRRVFGVGRDQVSQLINQANLVLANLRGTSRFAELLRNSLDESERKLILDVIDEVINADGVVDGYEVYLRQKFGNLLGLSSVKE